MNIFCYIVLGLDLFFNIFVLRNLKKQNEELEEENYNLRNKIKELEKV